MLARQIRDDADIRLTPLIMLTSGGRVGDSVKRHELMIAGSLMKPVKQSELFDVIVSITSNAGPRILPPAPATVPESGKSMRSLKILLAEDNLMNQKLASGILARHGHQLTIANNGLEAVAAYQAERFDVILMDVQMPLMDGFAATAAIRELEKVNDTKTPIVAMTAHALKGDRERCLAAGMDEYLSKPIRSKQLAAILGTLMQNENLPETSPYSPNAESLPVDSLIDWTTALEGVDGDRELLKSVVEVFLEESQRLFQDLKSAVHAQDTARVRSRGHSLKGAMLGVGAFTTADLAQSLEMGAGDGSLQSMAETLQDLEQKYGRITAELREFLRS